MFAEAEPLVVAGAALNYVAADRHARVNDAERVLRKSWERTNKLEFLREVVNPWLGQSTIASWYVRSALKQIPFERMNQNELIAWMAEDPNARARAMAEILGPPEHPISDMHAEMHEQFGAFDVGREFYSALVSAWSGDQ